MSSSVYKPWLRRDKVHAQSNVVSNRFWSIALHFLTSQNLNEMSTPQQHLVFIIFRKKRRLLRMPAHSSSKQNSESRLRGELFMKPEHAIGKVKRIWLLVEVH